jgi:hypothetical protein
MLLDLKEQLPKLNTLCKGIYRGRSHWRGSVSQNFKFDLGGTERDLDLVVVVIGLVASFS